jgi:hypothetical protein
MDMDNVAGFKALPPQGLLGPERSKLRMKTHSFVVDRANHSLELSVEGDWKG